MHISFNDKNTLLVGCDDVEMLEVLKIRMGGQKVRNKNQFIAPIKSGPKLYRFKEYGLEWDHGVESAVSLISTNITKRKQAVRVIRSQYGHEINFDYDLKGIYPPLEHQKIIYNMIRHVDVSSILAEPGTCKTGPYLWAIDKRKQLGQVKKALVITLSTLKKNVLEEMVVQTPHLTGTILTNAGGKANKILNKKFKSEKKNIDYDIYVASYEAAHGLVDLFGEDYFQMLILDEAHRIGSPGSRQTKSIIEKFEHIPYKAIVSGTINANSCLSFFMPFRSLGPDTIPTANYYEFRKQNMFQVDQKGYIWREVSGTKKFVSQIIGNISVFFSKDECLDLPGVVYKKSYCDMDPKQAKYYKGIKDDLITKIEDMCEQCSDYAKCKGNGKCDNVMVVKSALTAIGKLQQVACGFYMNTVTEVDDFGKEVQKRNIITFSKNPKLNLLIENINNIPPDKKIIIWSQYVHAIEMIKERLDKTDLGESLTVYKSQDAFEQTELFKDPKYRFLIANPSKAGVGLNLQFSSYEIFYSNNYSYIQREQAIGRQDRQGQTEKVTVIDLMCNGTVDEVILKALEAKEDLSARLVSLCKVIK